MSCLMMLLRCAGFGMLMFAAASVHAEAVKVAVSPKDGITRAGKSYFIRGAGGVKHLDELAKRGGNSIRTWGDKELPSIFEQAGKLGLTVCAGIWLEPECAWFSYHNPEHCAKQTERVKNVVRTHRDQSTLLLWGLGNEAEGDGSNADYWKQLNRLALMVHEEDHAHPTLTALAGITEAKAAGLNQHAPALDLVGINTYGALQGLRELLAKCKWTRPWVVTEYGPQGFWEVPKTTWGAPREPTSTYKAAMIRSGYEKTIIPGGACTGSYVFYWGQKQEATPTWFGVYTPRDESTSTLDVLEELWTKRKPANCAPDVSSLVWTNEKAAVKSNESLAIEATVGDIDGDPLTTRWEVAEDIKRQDADGHELPPPVIETSVEATGFRATIKAPARPGPYRVFFTVTDGKGHAATGNIPFQVTK